MAESQQREPQHQDHQPGTRAEMVPPPVDSAEDYKGSGKLTGEVAIVTGGDSGIGRATALAYAKEGADVCIVYLEGFQEAEDTKTLVERVGGKFPRCEVRAILG
jgi:hypothetical protein